MPTAATLHPRPPPTDAVQSPLPLVLWTPTGLALLELQGTINTGGDKAPGAAPTRIGRLDFPEYVAGQSEDGGPWMKRVYLYVGSNQRLTGEIRKLPRPVAVIRRRRRAEEEEEEEEGVAENGEEDIKDETRQNELEVVEIVRYKLVFSQRPEPVGAETIS